MASRPVQKPDGDGAAGANQQEPTQQATPLRTPVVSPLGANKKPTAKAGINESQNQGEGKCPSTSSPVTLEAQFLRLETKNVRFQGCLVVLATVAIVVGYWQWDATNKQYEVMIADQRPWLSFGVPEIEQPRIDYPVMGSIKIRNSGKTPGVILGDNAALLTRNQLEVLVVDTFGAKRDPGVALEIEKLLADMRKTSRGLGTDIVIPPGEEIEYPITSNHVMTQDSLDELRKEKRFVVVPYIAYRYTSGNSHESWACFVHVPETGKFVRNPRHNHMD